MGKNSCKANVFEKVIPARGKWKNNKIPIDAQKKNPANMMEQEQKSPTASPPP